MFEIFLHHQAAAKNVSINASGKPTTSMQALPEPVVFSQLDNYTTTSLQLAASTVEIPLRPRIWPSQMLLASLLVVLLIVVLWWWLVIIQLWFIYKYIKKLNTKISCYSFCRHEIFGSVAPYVHGGTGIRGDTGHQICWHCIPEFAHSPNLPSIWLRFLHLNPIGKN